MEIVGLILGFACLIHMFGLGEKHQTKHEMELMSRHMKKNEDS